MLNKLLGTLPLSQKIALHVCENFCGAIFTLWPYWVKLYEKNAELSQKSYLEAQLESISVYNLVAENLNGFFID